MYQRIQPETRLYIVEGVGKKINANWESTVIRIQLQNKSYNKLFFKRKLTHIYTLTLFTHAFWSFIQC